MKSPLVLRPFSGQDRRRAPRAQAGGTALVAQRYRPGFLGSEYPISDGSLGCNTGSCR